MTDSDTFDRIIVWLDAYQQTLEKLRKPEAAERIRQIAHELALYRIEVFGKPL